jgi:hypothetical protein
MIYSISKDGIKRRAILNEEVILIDIDDSLSFVINDVALNLDLTLNITFSNEGKELTTTGTVQDNGKVINMTLFQWNNSLGAELTKPIELSLINSKRIWIKFRTAADVNTAFRRFSLTIWLEE